ncbi:hypothetical protein L6248_00865, partial [Candidatus Parcubacteria bacterium]|nr:hypothetical protein [Candidatus Parcubacteria bacterium]
SPQQLLFADNLLGSDIFQAVKRTMAWNIPLIFGKLFVLLLPAEVWSLIGLQSQFQIIPQVSKGWKVDSEGRLVAKLQPGEEEQRVFRISEGYSTPWFVLPPEKYRFRADYQQTVIVEEKGRDKKIVHPNDLDNRGITQGSRREFRFTALKGGAEIIITLRRI